MAAATTRVVVVMGTHFVLFAILLFAVGAAFVAIGVAERRAAARLPSPPLDFVRVPSGAARLRGVWRLGPAGWQLEPLDGRSDPVCVAGAVSLPRDAEGRVGEARGELGGASALGGGGHPFRGGAAHGRMLVVRRPCDAFTGTLGDRIARSATTIVVAGGVLAYAGVVSAIVAAAAE